MEYAKNIDSPRLTLVNLQTDRVSTKMHEMSQCDNPNTVHILTGCLNRIDSFTHYDVELLHIVLGYSSKWREIHCCTV